MQVVIRIKPPHNDPHACKSVYLSDDQDKTLVVETPNKKEFFVFDNIADEHSTQQELYQYIGQDAVKSSTQVRPLLLRASIAAYSHMARPAPERPTRFWATHSA